MLRKIVAFTLCSCAVVVGHVFAAPKSSKQSAIQTTTTVRTKVEASGLYDQECYDAYFGCMDQFCITDNANGGRCACSDDNLKMEQELSDIMAQMEEAERISTTEVDRVKSGANADIVFTGTRRYDENGNVINSTITEEQQAKEEAKAQKKAERAAVFAQTSDEEDGEDEVEGLALYEMSDELCKAQIPDSCESDYTFLRKLYSRQITSDCKGFENSINTKRAEAKSALANAEIALRNAQKETLDSANKYNLGECMIEFKNCMQGTDACGTGWANCVATIASENMQNNTAVSTANTKVATVDKYDITASTMEILESKRSICERVLDQCVSVRDNVWPYFLRESAPAIKVAESKVESQFRQSCLSDISSCIQNACVDDIVNKGVATMDACLSRPEMVRSFCKVEIDPCERMEPLIWGYVTDKLAAMRVDACTQEVKTCFTADTRCGADFSNCIGMDYDYIRNICPLDSLVVCKANNAEFSMDSLDSMLMGLYLNIDNAALENCQNLVDAKMAEVCGSTTDCNTFAADDVIGTESLRSQKDGTVYRITGMISFGSIKMGDGVTNVTDSDKILGAGEIGIQDYLQRVREENAKVDNADGIISSIEEELNNIAGTINRAVQLIEQDTEIQYCINGRDLSQITGKKGKTTARFPNLLNQVKIQIATAALRKAQDNYNAKLTKAIADATQDASVDIAQYMCQMLPQNNGVPTSGQLAEGITDKLTPPYAISYEVSSGLTTSMLSQGAGTAVRKISDNAVIGDDRTKNQTLSTVANALTLNVGGLLVNSVSSGKVKMELPSGSREMWALFNRETRVCHYCTSTMTKDCVAKKTAFKKEMNCAEHEPVEKCEDIQM